MLKPLSRTPVPVVVLILLFLAPTELSVYFAGLRLPPHRIALIVLLPFALARLLRASGPRLHGFDIALTAFTAWSLYSFSANGQGTAGLDPAFTLYRGAFLNGAHDDSTIDQLNPVDPITFLPIQSVTDADPSGQYLKHSGYRDTVNNTYEGQFDAFGSWSMGNAADLPSGVEYVLAVSGTSDSDPSRGLTWGGNGNHDTAVGTGESLLQYFLPAGTYSIAAGGEGCNDASAACRGPFHSATFSLHVQPVPLPAAFWLMGSALGSLGLVARRRKRTSC